MPYAKGVAGKCFQNVDSYIAEHGGKRVVGLEHPIKSKYQVLTDSSLAQEFIDLRKQIEKKQEEKMSFAHVDRA